MIASLTDLTIGDEQDFDSSEFDDVGPTVSKSH